MKTSQTPTPIAAMRRIGFISETLHTVDPDEPILTVKEFFDTHAPISAVVVEKQNRAVGLVMNIHLNLKLSQRYGFSLFSKKPISSIMDPSPLTVAHDQSIEQAAALAMQRRSDRLYDHIIILKNQRPYGVVAVRTILNSLLESNRERTDILERYTGRLEKEDLEKRKAIQGLEDSRKMLQLVIDAIPHAIFWKDRNCVYLGCNQTFARDAGIQETRQVIGLSDRELPWTDREADLFTANDHKVMDNDAPMLNRHQIQTNARGVKRFLNANKVPLHDAKGQVVGVLCFYQDITQKLQDDNERSRLQAKLARAQKMEALGNLAGGVAHDLNNILSGIVNYPDLIMMDMPDDSPFIRPLKTIQESGFRAAAVVQDLLTLARRGVTQKEITDLNDIVFQYLESPECLNIQADHPLVSISADTEPELQTIEGSPVHLIKSLMNLVNNSVEAIDGPGEVVIRTRNRHLDQPVSGYSEIREGRYVALSVSDTGFGICEQDIDKIFEPFYTKKQMGRSGTGLGMAVVWGTVKDLDGYIDVKSREDAGTTVTLYIPAKQQARILTEKSEPSEDLTGNGQTILVVDDVPEQREIASGYLSRMNYRVKAFESGEKALEYIRQEKADLVILDMIMEPGMDGLETYMKILEVYPDQQAIITSGFSESDRVKKAQQLGAGAYIRKPYNFKELGRAIKNELLKTG